jgi:hypothetical protein
MEDIMKRIAIGAAAAAVAVLAVCGTSQAAPIAPIAGAEAQTSNVIPAYYWRGGYYRYRWGGGYYRYYWGGRYYLNRRWRNGAWFYY